ncbi:MAG: tagaturonate reductase [Leadbetterella sp.]
MLLSKSNTDKHTYPVKILQFGTGNFLRGFIGPLVETLNESHDFKGAIQIIKNVNDHSTLNLNDQDGLYYFIEQGIQNQAVVSKTKVIKSIHSVINPFRDFSEFLALGLNPELKVIISNTTEKGIFFDETVLDLTVCPENFAAKLTLLLHFRFKNFRDLSEDKIAIIPCELIENNGKILKQCILDYAHLWKLDPGFLHYLDSHIHFYNTLVDRIVPGFPSNKTTKLPFVDHFTVMAEPYWLFLLQGSSMISEIFPLESLAPQVQLVEDLSKHRNLKVRILNGLHTLMVGYAASHGISTVREFMENTRAFEYIKKCAFENIIPSLDSQDEIAKVYTQSIFERYLNPYIEHKIGSIALNSISKFKVRVIPSLLDYYNKHSTIPQHLVVGFAQLIFFYHPNFEDKPFEVNDDKRQVDVLREFWSAEISPTTIRNLLFHNELWGNDLQHVHNLGEVLIEELSLLTDHLTKEIHL